MFQRTQYLNQLIRKRNNGYVKVITGLRRVGKSYLLKEIFIPYLLKEGIPSSHILVIDLEDGSKRQLRNPIHLLDYVLSQITDADPYYIFIDEIQLSVSIENPDAPGDFITFYDVCSSLMKRKNVDLFVTGSNSRMLSSDILTQFRGRSDEIRVSPLTFKEIMEEYKDNENKRFEEYLVYGGMPQTLLLDTYPEKAAYLDNLKEKIYLTDIKERNNVDQLKGLQQVGRILSTTVGSKTSIEKLTNTFSTVYKEKSFSWNTIKKYVDGYKDAYILEEVMNYDMVGRRNIEGPHKFYFTDLGLRNSFASFSHVEEHQALENVVYNELVSRGFHVEVGSLTVRQMEGEVKKSKTLEVDFIASLFTKKYYIQVAVSVKDEEKYKQETRPFLADKTFHKRVLLVEDDIVPQKDEYGILTLGIKQFLLDESSLDL